MGAQFAGTCKTGQHFNQNAAWQSYKKNGPVLYVAVVSCVLLASRFKQTSSWRHVVASGRRCLISHLPYRYLFCVPSENRSTRNSIKIHEEKDDIHWVSSTAQICVEINIVGVL